MDDITLSSELKEKVVEAMIQELLSSGISYSLKQDVEQKFKVALDESGVLDQIVGGIIERVMSDKEMIIAAVSQAMLDGVAQTLAAAHKSAAKEIIDKLKRY